MSAKVVGPFSKEELKKNRAISAALARQVRQENKLP